MSASLIAYEFVDIGIALAFSIWCISTKGYIHRGKPIHSIQPKFLYYAGFLGLGYVVIRLVEIFA